VHEAIVAAYPAVFRYAYVLTGDQAQAEDICQEAVVKTLWRARRAAFTNVEAYLIRVALNDFLQKKRHRQRSREAERAASEQQPQVWNDTHTADVLSALDVLTPRERAAVVGRFYLSLTEREVAEAMNVTVGSVKQFSSRAMKKLRHPEHSPAGIEPARLERM
jgi:RNA polymerase sigma factor (sigma-70 family)